MTHTAQHYISCSIGFSGNRSRGSFLVEVRTRLRSLSMRGYLLLLVFSVAIPGALFAAILLQRYYNSEVARINQDLLNNAHQLAQTVDRDLAGLQATLQTLALSRSLSVGDHESFYRQAAQVRDYVGAHVMLRDASGQSSREHARSARDGAAGRGPAGRSRGARAQKAGRHWNRDRECGTRAGLQHNRRGGAERGAHAFSQSQPAT